MYQFLDSDDLLSYLLILFVPDHSRHLLLSLRHHPTRVEQVYGMYLMENVTSRKFKMADDAILFFIKTFPLRHVYINIILFVRRARLRYHFLYRVFNLHWLNKSLKCIK